MTKYRPLYIFRDWLRSWTKPAQKPSAEEQLDIVKRARAERWAIWGLENGLETLTERLRDHVADQGVEIR